MHEQTESLIPFPCEFAIKAMGKAEPDFDLLVYELVRKHVPDIHEGAVRSRPSKGGKWVSVTVTVHAQSKRQLDAIYRELTAHEKIVMAL
jgi:putative lipoic acid-binding regulatory protein